MGGRFAVQLSEYSNCVVMLRTGGCWGAVLEAFEGRAAIEEELTKQTHLGRTATLEDVGHVAVFAASDWARMITGAALNMTCGTVLD